jgi:hypothetical protein
LVFLALGGNGTLRGDGAMVLAFDRRPKEAVRVNGDSDGESGELGDGEVDLEVTSRNVGPLEGERDNDRRSCARVEAGS